MAIEKIVEIKVDAKQATKSLQDLGGSFEDVYGEVQPLSGRIGELEDRLYEMALAGESGTKEFKDLTREIGSMKKVIIDTDRTVDGMSQTMAQNLGGALGGVTAAFELGAGAMGAMGVESEKVQEALLKVQSASAIASGFQGLKESVSSFRALGAAIKASTVVQRVFNLVMSANPIGVIITAITALIAGITALIANFKSITDWLGITDNEAEKLHSNNVERAQEFVKIQEKRVEAVKKESDAIGRRYDFEIAKARAAGKETFDLEQEKRRQVIQSTKQEIKAVQDVLKAKITAFQVMYGLSNEQAKLALAENESIQALIAQINDLRIEVEETQNEIVVADIEHNKQRTEAVKKATETQAEIRKKAQEKKEAEEEAAREKEKARLAKEAQDQAELLAQITQLEDEYLNSKISKEQQEINAVNDKYFATLEAARLAGEETFLLEEAQQQAILDIQKRYADEKKAVDKELDDKKKETAKEELLREQELQKQKLQLASSAFGAIGDLINSFAGESEEAQRKAFQVTKAVNLAQAITNTALAVTGALTAGGNPIKLATGMQFVEAGIAAAAGAAQIATIARTQFNGGGGSPPSPPNAPNTATSQPANFNVVGNTGTNQLADTLGSSPMKAYVVAGDVTSAQSLERNKIQQSTL